MIHQLIDFVQSQLHGNQFLAGGFMLGIIAGMIHWLKNLPIKFYHWFLRRFTVEVDIPDRDEAFLWIDKWLSAHTYSRNWARDLTVRTERPGTPTATARGVELYDDDEIIDRNQQPKIILSPAPGRHLFFYKRRLISLYRERKDGAEENKISFGIRESFVLRIFARNRKIATTLLEEARELVHPQGERKVTILTEEYGSWCSAGHQRIRALDSVILPNGKMDELVREIERFRDNQAWYIDRGIPWRLGVLLFGPPGSGKSSTALAIASHFNMDIALLNLNGFTASDETLRKMMSRLPPNTLVLLEDVDCLGIARVKRGGNMEEKISFSGFLNAIDGVAASEGRILLMTTNHIEKLDPALIRPGRADVKMEIGPPCPEQKRRLFQRFYPEASRDQVDEFVHFCNLESMAAIQGHLLSHPSSPASAVLTCHTTSTVEAVSK